MKRAPRELKMGAHPIGRQGIYPRLLSEVSGGVGVVVNFPRCLVSHGIEGRTYPELTIHRIT